MERFVLGRLLWRLSRCEGANQFVLKGAQLFSLWAPEIHRPTRDLDLLSFGDSSPQKMELFFRALLSRPAEPEDGLVWGGVAVERIREDQRYEGVRITVRATLDGAVIPAEALPELVAACRVVPAELGESIGDLQALAAAMESPV
jgi:hypothetical protein